MTSGITHRIHVMPSCTITGWASDFRALGPSALGHENHSANQLSHSGISGFYELSPRSKVVNPQLTLNCEGIIP